MISPYNVHKIEDKLLVDGSYRNSIYIVLKSNSQDLYKNCDQLMIKRFIYFQCIQFFSSCFCICHDDTIGSFMPLNLHLLL